MTRRIENSETHARQPTHSMSLGNDGSKRDGVGVDSTERFMMKGRKPQGVPLLPTIRK